MAKGLPFGAAWEQAVLYLGRLGNALEETQFSSAHVFDVVVALAVGVGAKSNALLNPLHPSYEEPNQRLPRE